MTQRSASLSTVAALDHSASDQMDLEWLFAVRNILKAEGANGNGRSLRFWFGRLPGAKRGIRHFSPPGPLAIPAARS